ncbi:MAG: TldD/PmbA family protein [candidate division Zixibacteria bacterium]|nr:TldD/PmbA family protein [candidate division Zixibacteria bacterium]
MNKKERLELANWAVNQAKKSGAQDVGVDISYNRDVEVGFRDGRIEQLKESAQSSLSLSIYANKRYSSHWTNDMRKDSLEKFIQQAVAMTKYLSEDPFRSLPDPKYYEGQKKIDLNNNDPVYEKVSPEKRLEIAQKIEEIARAQSDKIISCTSGYSDTFYESTKVNSNGFEGESQGTYFSAGAEVVVKDEGGKRPEDWEWATVRLQKDLPSPEVLGKKASQRALGKIGQSKLQSGSYDMLLENRVGGRFLYSLAAPMSGRSLQQKSSYLEGKLGQKIGSDKLTIIDDPFISSGMGSRLFDDEGMATKLRVMVDKGILKEFYIDSYYAKKLGMEPTSGSASNVIFDYGTRALDKMIEGTKKGILVNTFIGGNSNSTTGDFSYGIIGTYIEDGKIIKPVSEMNITGNLADLLNQLVEVGNDPYIYSSLRTPTLYFKDVQFSGI